MVRRGFTLIELLVFAAIFTVVMVGFVTILIAVTRVQSRQSSANDVQSQGQFLLQQIQYYVQSARLVDMPENMATSTLTLRESVASSLLDPTVISLATGTVYLSRGIGGAAQPLTSNKVTVSNILFTRHYNLSSTSAAFGVDSVSYSFTMTNAGTNATKYYSQQFQSSAAVLTPVPAIALIQQTSTVNYGSVMSVGAAYGTMNESGDLLIAVVANPNANATVFLSDTAGNGWTKIANPTSTAFNAQFAVFSAQSAGNSTNTVTASFGTAVTNPSLFLYEYRGAAVSSPFDALAVQVQVGTTTFSSGSAAATSTVELAFGVLYVNPLPAGTIVAGNGFTMQASSSVNNIFIEDKNLYVTGPVAATWSSAQAASSSAAIVTFSTIPKGWAKVPGNAAFGTSDFWVMKYSAVCSDGHGNYLNDHLTSNATYDNSTSTGLPCTPANNRQIASLPGGDPIANVTQTAAIQACTSIGAHLLTNAEWQTIAWSAENVASNWSGGSVGSGSMPAGNWAATPNTPKPASSNDGTGISSGRAVTLSNGSVIWDMNGNVWEILGDTIVGSHEPYGSGSGFQWWEFTDPSIVYNVMSQATVGPMNTAWNSSQNIGDLYAENGSGDSTIYIFRRGGFAGNAGCNLTYCGINTLLLNFTQTSSGNYVGFRCAAGDGGSGGTAKAW